ncbi:MAG: MFS transporter [Steroidobacteraceae bacterium]
MSALQYAAIAICIVINLIDGFDVIAVSFAAPEIARDWALEPTMLGAVFSSGLAGMVLGALFLSPLADRYGRRPLILSCLFVIGAGMLASAVAGGVSALVAARFATGLGVGGMLSSLTTMVAEYSNDRRRQFAISILQTGYPAGGIIAALSSAFLLDMYGWRSIFIAGGLISLAMIPAVFWRLPESIDFLMNRRRADALDRINQLLRRMNMATVTELPPTTAGRRARASVIEIFDTGFRSRTFAIWICFLMVMSSWYFVVNWTPKILVDSGLSRDAAISGGMLISVGGMLGGLALGWLSTRVRVSLLGAIFMFLAVVSMTAFGQLEVDLTAMLATTFLIGFCLAASMISLYATVPELYPARVRNTGTGWALGIGRLGAVIGPYVAGIVIGAGWERSTYFFALSTPLLISVVALTWLGSRTGSTIRSAR